MSKLAGRWFKMVQDGSQDGPKMAPRGSQDAPKSPKRPQDVPRWSRMGPRCSQDGPKMPQEAPKEAGLETCPDPNDYYLKIMDPQIISFETK